MFSQYDIRRELRSLAQAEAHERRSVEARLLRVGYLDWEVEEAPCPLLTPGWSWGQRHVAPEVAGPIGDHHTGPTAEAGAGSHATLPATGAGPQQLTYRRGPVRVLGLLAALGRVRRRVVGEAG
jgi:hypothetical protein